MENRTGKMSSDAERYCQKDAEKERFYEIFFQMCPKYGVRWASAEEKERQFIEEVTRVTSVGKDEISGSNPDSSSIKSGLFCGKDRISLLFPHISRCLNVSVKSPSTRKPVARSL